MFRSISGHGQDTYFKEGYPLEIISARTIKRNEFSFVILRNMSKKKIETPTVLATLKNRCYHSKTKNLYSPCNT